MDHLRSHAEAFEAELNQAVSLGTTIMAAAYDGGVVLGADSRTSTGNYVANRVTDKLTPLTDKVYVCRSGSAADTQNLAAYVQLYLHQHQMELGGNVSVRTAARLAQQIVYNNKAMLQAGLIVAGWDARDGGSVFGVPLGGTLVKVPFTIGGSGSAYIYGFCDKNWKAGMSEADCHAFVVKAVSHAMARDGSSGGCIRTVVINKDGVKRHFLPNHEIPAAYGELQPPLPARVAVSGGRGVAAGAMDALCGTVVTGNRERQPEGPGSAVAEPGSLSSAWPDGLLRQLPAPHILTSNLLSAARELSQAFPDASGYRTPEPQVRSVALGPPPLRHPQRRSLPPLGHLMPRVLHFGAAECKLGEACPLHGHRGAVQAKTPPVPPELTPSFPLSQHAASSSAWLPGSASSSPASSCDGSSSGAASQGRRRRRRERCRSRSASPMSAAEAAALRVRCGQLEARLLALGIPLPPAGACAAGASDDADSGSDSDAHSSDRVPFSGACKRARGNAPVPAEAGLA